MKALSSVIVLGIGFLMVSGSPARAQLGDMGDAVKKGAGDAVKQEVMKGAAEKAGLPAPGAPAAAPAADTGAASAPVGEPQVAPAAADAPAAVRTRQRAEWASRRLHPGRRMRRETPGPRKMTVGTDPEASVAAAGPRASARSS